MLHGAAPEHVLQGHGIVVDVETGDSALHLADGLVIDGGLGVVVLSAGEGAAVDIGDALPRGVEERAVAVGDIMIGLVQRRADVVIGAALGIALAPLGKGVGGPGVAGEHIHAVGLAAGVAVHGGDHAGAAGVAGLIEPAEIVQIGVVPLDGGIRHGMDQQAAGHQTHHHSHAQQQGGSLTQ